MLPVEELADMTVEKAAEYLAARAVQVRHGELSWQEKRANQISDVLSSLGDQIKANPVLGKALIGGGLGAAAGGVGHMMHGDEDDKPHRGSLLGNMATGALAGGALGGGIGAAQQLMPRGGGAPSSTPGEFTHNGERLRVTPDLLRSNPDMLRRIQDASSDGPFWETLPSKAWNMLANNPVAPWSTRALPGMAAADIALHNQRLNLGERNWLAPVSGGLNRLGQGANRIGLSSVGNALTGAGQRVQATGEHLRDQGMFPGMIHAENSRNPQHMDHGIDEALRNLTKDVKTKFSPVKETLEQLTGNRPMNLVDAAGNPLPGRQGRDVMNDMAANRQDVHAQHTTTTLEDQLNRVRERRHERREQAPRGQREIISEHTDPITGKKTTDRRIENAVGPGEYLHSRSTVDKMVNQKVPVTSTSTQNIDPHLQGELAAMGARRQAVGAGKPEGAFLPHGEPAVFRSGALGRVPGLRPGDNALMERAYMGGRGLKRLGMYAAPFAAEWALRGLAGEYGRSSDLGQLLQEARQRGQVVPAGGQR